MRKLTILAAVASIAILSGTAQSQPAATQPATGAAPAQKIDPNRSADYTSGKWKYHYQITFGPGTPTQGAHGALSYDGRELKDGDGPTNNYYQTPWGRLYNTGQPNTPSGPHGWMPYPRGGHPAGKELPDPGQLAASQPAPALTGELAITEESNGKTVPAPVGQKIVIRIPSEGPGPKPPPQWTAKLDGNSLTQVGAVALRAKTVAGPGGLVAVRQGGPMVAEATFVASAPGKTTVTLEARPFGRAGGAPTKTFSVTVEVSAGQPPKAPSGKEAPPARPPS